MQDQPAVPSTETSPPTLPTDRRALLAGLGGLAAGAFFASTANAGPLNPPLGPIQSTPGPEPRIPINAANTPGTATALFRITQPGSYYLTANITGVSGKHGIEIAADGVTIDLMGFDLLGVPGVGSFSGVIKGSAGVRNITIRNGSVRNWSLNGINLSANGLATGGHIDSVNASGNSSAGIMVGINFTIHNCTATENNFTGIITGMGCTITGCTAGINGSNGFSVGTGCLVTNCTATGNGIDGILAAGGSTVTNCCASGNGRHGIAPNGSCLIRGNSCRSHTAGAGIRIFFSDNRVEANSCIGNSVGVQALTSGNFIAANTCAGNTTNWDIAANNVCLVVAATAISTAFSGNSGGLSPGSTNPNANYTY
jgi:parallel beta-helix repeat protein